MKPKYSTWIRLKRVQLFILIFLILICSFFIIQNMIFKFLILALIIIFGYISSILLISYYCFCEKGLNYQQKIHELIVSRITADKKIIILDIGAGSGSLSIKTAKKNKEFIIKAIDYWGKDWNYSRNQTIINSQIEKVDNQIEFIKASASKLPYEKETFDVIISCLTFHEVHDTKDKSKVIDEALRVLKPGGEFIFFDLFRNKSIFGQFNNFLEKIIKNKVNIIETAKIEELFPNCPKMLLHKKVLGYGALIIGKKIIK